MGRMEWDNLLSDKRERLSKSKDEPFRNTFDKDYERVIGSSSIRRLQDKAQVYPLQENDFTRTRLTHSMEVSSIGRSVGCRIGYALKEMGELKGDQDKALSSLLAVAGLVHDLGNPPFGHYGEDILHKWFEDNQRLFQCSEYVPTWLSDYLYFDGNAQTIRILSRLQFLHDGYGMNFCYGTLGTLLKYPWPSDSSMAKSKKKIGYFITESSLIEDVISTTGMKSEDGKIFRHPATYLLEAADDIAYLFADLEDTVKKGYMPWSRICDWIIESSKKVPAFSGLPNIMQMSKQLNQKNCVPQEEWDGIEAMDLRVCCQGICIEQVCNEFLRNYDRIMRGEYEGSLLNCEALAPMVGNGGIIRQICIDYAYHNNEVLSLELIGKSVLTSLLDKFINAIVDEKDYLKPRTESGKLYRLISRNFEYIQKFNGCRIFDSNKRLDLHARVQLVVDFISCMTDSYALNLHKTLLGMRLP